MSEVKKTLQPDAQAKFNLTPGHGVGIFKFKGNLYDLSLLNSKQLDDLVAIGYDGVTLKQPPVEAKAK